MLCQSCQSLSFHTANLIPTLYPTPAPTLAQLYSPPRELTRSAQAPDVFAKQEMLLAQDSMI